MLSSGNANVVMGNLGYHVITQITLSHFASNNFLLYHEK
jgi:hypothetical protein